MNRTIHKLTLLFLVVVLAFGVQTGVRFSAQGVAKAKSGSTIYLPLIARPDEPRANLRRVNIPYFSPTVNFGQSAIFWFGRVTADQNYADVRIGYSPTELTIKLAAFDRRIWYNKDETTQALATLTDWDGMALYLNMEGGDARQPGSQSYRFVAQYYENQATMRANHKAAYQGDGSGWRTAAVSFTTENGYRGNAPDDDVDDDGWRITMHIPFSSLGLSGPPANGTVWGMAVDMYDRDSEAGPPNAVKTWPQAPDPYGQVVFGIPGYTPAPYTFPSTPLILRQGLNGVTVKDAMVGGSSVCGEGLNRWTQWGDKNWYGKTFFNIQNQDDYSDFPCFSKEYLTFPLNGVPEGKIIVSAKLVLHQFGNADPNTAKDSYIQVMRVAEDWDPQKITWNTAPLALENYSAAWVHAIGPEGVPIPGNPYEFDLSRAAADAYREGQPLRIVLYSADPDYSSGKYFISSYEEDWDAVGRPRLEVVWGEPRSSNTGSIPAPSSDPPAGTTR